MISERLFARSYTSFWAQVTPLSEALIRTVNAQWEGLASESETPTATSRAIANEGAVRLYRMLVEGRKNDPGVARDALVEAATWLGLPKLGKDDELLSGDMIAEAQIMASNLSRRFGDSGVLFAPKFPGCGIINACEGDLVKGRMLVEVKSGYRTFRSTDIRQVLVYLALNHAAETIELDEMEIYNPRLERAMSFSVEELCLRVAGEAPADVFSRIVQFAVDGVVSGF